MFFHESDGDNDGFLTLDELTKTLRKYGFKGSDEEIRVGYSVHGQAFCASVMNLEGLLCDIAGYEDLLNSKIFW